MRHKTNDLQGNFSSEHTIVDFAVAVVCTLSRLFALDDVSNKYNYSQLEEIEMKAGISSIVIGLFGSWHAAIPGDVCVTAMMAVSQ